MQPIEALNKLNLELSHVQRATTQMILLLQEGKVGLTHDGEHLVIDYATAGAQTLNIVTENLGGILAKLREQHLAASAAQADSNLRKATEQPTAPMSPGRKQIADIADGLAKNMLARKLGPDGPDFMARVDQIQTQREQAAQRDLNNDMPTPARGPAAASDHPTHATESQQVDLRSRGEEQKRAGLLDLLVGKNGVIARWFSSGVYTEGRGVIAPNYNDNYYTNDISQMPYDRLMKWPEGFYRDERTSAFQYLLKTSQMIMTINFGPLTDVLTDTRAAAVECFFHGEQSAVKTRLPATRMSNDLLHGIIGDIDARLRAQYSAA